MLTRCPRFLPHRALQPFLYIGLSGLTLVEAVIRSAGAPGLTMSHGISVSDESVPEEMKELYTALVKAKQEYEAALPITTAELEFVRQSVLFAGDREVSVLCAWSPPPTARCGGLTPTWPGGVRDALRCTGGHRHPQRRAAQAASTRRVERAKRGHMRHAAQLLPHQLRGRAGTRARAVPCS